MKEVKVTDEQLKNLWDELNALPAAPVGKHLEPHEMVMLATEILPDEEAELFMKHLESCPKCCAEVDDLVVAEEKRLKNAVTVVRAATEFSQQTEALRGAVRQGTQFWSELIGQAAQKITFWLRGPGEAEAFAFQTKKPVRFSRPDGLGNVCIWETDKGNLEIRVDSKVMEHAGKKLRVKFGTWQRELLLEKVDSDQVGGRATIAKAERKKLPSDAKLEVELVP